MPKQKTEIGPPSSDRALYSDKARSFNQSERALYQIFIIILTKDLILEIDRGLRNIMACTGILLTDMSKALDLLHPARSPSSEVGSIWFA